MRNLKTISALSIVILLLGSVCAFALESLIVSVNENSTIHVEYLYNAYGVAISSTQTTTTITTTTNEKGEISTTTTEYTTKSFWKGGSLKVESTTGTSKTTSTEGANSTTEFWTNYEYNANGQLKSVSGGGTTNGNRGKDDDGKELGTYVSDAIDTYIVQNGQALKSKTVTTGINKGPDGQKESDFTETSTYEYALIGGGWVLVKEVEKSETKNVDASTTLIDKIKTYQRDANGVCTGITQTATGTYKAVGDGGGRQTYTMQNYQAEFKFDAKIGWYLAKESYDWKS